MTHRLVGILLVVVLGLAVVSAPASAQQVSPGGANSQVDEYTGPGGGGGGGTGDGANDPGVDGGGTLGGDGGQLPFTGLAILPLIIVGTLLVFAAPALRRRANSPSHRAAS